MENSTEKPSDSRVDVSSNRLIAEETALRCEKCGCLLVSVDSNVHKKWHECIRALNTPERCDGTELHWRDWPFDGRPKPRSSASVADQRRESDERSLHPRGSAPMEEK